MRTDEILTAQRAGRATPESVVAFVRGVVDGTVTRPQAPAWLAWAYVHPLDEACTVALTHAMAHSGAVLRWPDGPVLADKHSTGGIGDKVSLVLAPLWAELGRRVPMVSGRGLGHTGGTLDKLESIPGFRTDLEPDALQRVLADVGCFISGQTADLAPADRVLYALRDETQTVASIPLIVASILSKKVAAGVASLVLDVKAGSGAFMERTEDARALAAALVRTARGAGLTCRALVTAMDRPLGRTVGNALEVEEAVETLQGGGPEDLVALTLALTDDPRAADVLRSGAAYERFGRMVAAQGGALGGGLLGGGTRTVAVRAPSSGRVTGLDARGLGMAVWLLGAGRRAAGEPIDPGVGARVLVPMGQRVAEGEDLVLLYHRDGRGLEEARRLAEGAVRIDGEEGMALVVGEV
jgi:pyrimidine-nucleoside phosphorylase